jgi:hypothetical protein
VSGVPVQSADGMATRVRWIGWVLFAGLMAIMAGSIQALVGFCALFVDDVFVVGSDRLVVPINYTGWGVLHLAIGLVFLLVGYGIITGRAWSRGAGIVLGIVSAVLNMLFITAFPAWSLLVIAFDLLTIYALAVHGRTVIRYVTSGSVEETGRNA